MALLLSGDFLRAGAAPVQVPVRVGFEEAMLTSGELWAGEGTLVNSEDGEPDPLQLSVVAELRSQTGNNTIEGVGALSVSKNSAAVTGTGTNFTEDDEMKRIVIGGVTYVIKHVADVGTITLTSVYLVESDEAIGYAIGGKLVVQPWK